MGLHRRNDVNNQEEFEMRLSCRTKRGQGENRPRNGGKNSGLKPPLRQLT